MNIKHSSKSNLWYTPQWIIGAATKTLGHIDLDPASDEFGNSRVKANRYITEQEDGLKADWKSNNKIQSTVFCNPPGGLTPDRKSLTILFWKKLMEFRYTGCLSDAIFVTFSIEALQTSQNIQLLPAMGDFYCCIPNKRIKFDLQEGKANSPSHANAIIYVPGNNDRYKEFHCDFSPYGSILRGMGY